MMLNPPVLDDELDRLADLYSLDLVNANREERFDRLTRLARQALGTSMCYLALVDSDRQWLKSRCGISAESTDRNVSFCGHAIAHNELMIIPDALEDERFCDNPLVIGEPFIRFYAGYPLQGTQGHNIGTFCIADTSPRDLSAAEQEILIDFARLAQRELALLDLVQAQNNLLQAQSDLEKVRRRLENELTEASEFVIQKLPDRFEKDRVSLDWAFQASSQLGGDMFGFEPLSDDRFLVYLLDVAGHGLGASLLAISVQNRIRQLLADASAPVSPAGILESLNAEFQMEWNQNRFFTMWCGIVDTTGQKIRFANGGHLAPVIFDAALNSSRPGKNSLMIGITPNARYEDEECSFHPGSQLLIFSDGLTEELNEEGVQFGRDRLEESYRNRCRDSGCGLDAVLDGVRQWNGGKAFADDVSLVEVKFRS